MSVPVIFRSTDTSAGSLSNANGSLTTILDQVLVTGNATQTLTSLTHSAGTITGTLAAHGYIVGDIVSISGAVEDEYNGRVTILTTPLTSTFTYAPVGANPASSPATGTLKGNTPATKAGLGWQLIATGTNVRCYRPRFGTRMYFGIDDNVNVYEARVRGFETQTAAGVSTATGTGPYPTAAQQTNGLTWQKTVNTAGNREWIIAGDDRSVFFHVNADPTAAGSAFGFWQLGFWGDIGTYKASDAYNNLIVGKIASVASILSDRWDTVASFNTALTGGHYMPRTAAQTGTSIGVNLYTDVVRNSSQFPGAGTINQSIQAFPERISGMMVLCRYHIVEPAIGPRGWIKGLWNPACSVNAMMQAGGPYHGDTLNGASGLLGKTFEYRHETAQSAYCAIVFETPSGATWL